MIVTGKVLDASAMLDIAGGRSHYGQALVASALKGGDMIFAVPTLAFAEAWAECPPDGRRSLRP